MLVSLPACTPCRLLRTLHPPHPLLLALLQAHEAVRRAEEQEERDEGDAASRGERGPLFPEPRERERWDCESVLRWVLVGAGCVCCSHALPPDNQISLLFWHC